MPQQRRTDRAAIVAAAIAVLDERGLDKLSLHAIAARLGVRQPALYHHFEDKNALLSAVAAEVLERGHTDRLPEPGEDWRAFLTRNAHSLRRAMLSVRDGARLLAVAGPRAPKLGNALAQVTFLEHHGFTGTDAILAYVAVSRYTIGATLEQQTAPNGNKIRFPDPPATQGAVPGQAEGPPGSEVTVPGLADAPPGAQGAVPGPVEGPPGSGVIGQGLADALPGSEAAVAGPADVPPGAERLFRLVAEVQALGPDHEFAVGLTALVRGLSPSRGR
ncbi:TetR/AcrR family transcriptional regulator C-terminal domain-containing protein [Kribbella sp. GL6]|uniref:TetR/AcrR family transcriptional regulator C-terminal domain-containing protein n=1 Tax=Kribbella sp. GL6 TaxID=3419765 RepID=UPI003D094F9F